MKIQNREKLFMRQPSQKTCLALIIVFVLVISIFLRIENITLNTRVQGDVNLFALVAREFVQHDRLYYPMKYEFSNNVPYKALATPASQHPPLWPLTAGLIGKFLHIDDTFLLIKLMSVVVGIGMLLLIGILGWKWEFVPEALVAITLCAFSPILIDFSGNGSSYHLIALILFLSVILMLKYNSGRHIDYVLAGFLCAISLQVHTNTFLLPICFLCYWCIVGRNFPWIGITIATLSGFITILPWMIWNYHHFGIPLYSYSTFYFLKTFGFAKTDVVNDIVTTSLTGRSIDISFILEYTRQLKLVIQQMTICYFNSIDPFLLFLMVIGVFNLCKKYRRVAIALLLPFICYALTILIWATWRDRFIVPLVPVTCFMATAGFFVLFRSNALLKVLALLLLTSSILLNIYKLWMGPSTYYYNYDSSYSASYDAMIPLAKEIGKLEKGTVLGYSQNLDGGIETLYWHSQPFVYGRELPLETVAKIVNDFSIRYIWTDSRNNNQVKSIFPHAQEILSNYEFHIYKLF